MADSRMFPGHGYRVGRKGLFVGGLPGRKQTCLYVEERMEGGGCRIRTLAFFKTDEQAREALELIDKLALAATL